MQVRFRFRTTLVAILLALVLASVTIVGLIGYLNARFAAEELSSQALDQTTYRVEQQIGRILGVAAAQAAMYVELISGGQLDPDDCEALTAHFRASMEARPTLSYLSWTRERDGGYCQVRRTGDRLTAALVANTADPRRRPYYVQAQEADAPTWTESYVFLGGEEGSLDMPGLSRAVPVHAAGGRLLGVVTADFDLDALSRYLARLSIGERGMAVVIEQRRDGSRKVVGHPERSLLTRPLDPKDPQAGAELVPAEAIADARVVALLGQIPEGDASAREDAAPTPVTFESGGETWIGRWMRYDGDAAEGLRWTIGVVQPREEVMGRVERGNVIALAVIGATAVFAILLAFVLSGRLSRSLGRVAAESRRVGEFDLDSGEPIRTHLVEVQQLVDAMEHMKTGLRGFQRYLPLKLVRLLHEQRQEPALGGEDREVTIYFSDIAGFSAVSERTPPMEMARRLGGYLGALSERIRDHEGTVVQYVGDEIMGLWNAPLPVAGHPLKACRAALECAATGRALPFGPDGEPVDTRFGLHTVTVAVGHFGTEERLYYGAVGDGVNFCSRLEGLNKYYGTTILMSDACRRAVGDAVVSRPIDRVAVKGREGAALVHELVGLTGDVDETVTDALRGYAAALDDYFARRFEAAAAGFEAVLERLRDDPPSVLMLARCRHYLADPPPDDWDGVHRMRTK